MACGLGTARSTGGTASRGLATLPDELRWLPPPIALEVTPLAPLARPQLPRSSVLPHGACRRSPHTAAHAVPSAWTLRHSRRRGNIYTELPVGRASSPPTAPCGNHCCHPVSRYGLETQRDKGPGHIHSSAAGRAPLTCTVLDTTSLPGSRPRQDGIPRPHSPEQRPSSTHTGWLPLPPPLFQTRQSPGGPGQVWVSLGSQVPKPQGTDQECGNAMAKKPASEGGTQQQAWGARPSPASGGQAGGQAPGPTSPGGMVPTSPEAPLPTRSSCPKTVFSPRAEQFQRPKRNWYWHSLMPICAPSPITMMASGRLWQMARCRGARPGILLQMMLAPRATTDDSALRRGTRHREVS